MLNELIKLHEEGECSCEEFSEERDTGMCIAGAYLTGNISEEDALGFVCTYSLETKEKMDKYIIEDSFGNQFNTNDISEALASVEESKSMLDEYEEYVTLFENVHGNYYKRVRTWYINLDGNGNKYLDSKY